MVGTPPRTMELTFGTCNVLLVAVVVLGPLICTGIMFEIPVPAMVVIAVDELSGIGAFGISETHFVYKIFTSIQLGFKKQCVIYAKEQCSCELNNQNIKGHFHASDHTKQKSNASSMAKPIGTCVFVTL